MSGLSFNPCSSARRAKAVMSVAWRARAQTGRRPLDTRCRAAAWTCVAILAFAAAGCSQESARFNYDGDSAHAAEYRYSDTGYRDSNGYARWRRSKQNDPRRYRGSRRRSDITGQLPPDSDNPAHDSLSHRADGGRRDGRLTPPRERRGAARRRARPRAIYTVRSGDTLYSIAKRHGVDVGALARVNDLDDPGLIRVGDKLRFPRAGRPRYARDERRPRRARKRRYTRDENARRPERRPRRRERAAPDGGDDLYADPLLRDDNRRRARRPNRNERRSADRGSPERRDSDRRRSAERRPDASSRERRREPEPTEPTRTAVSVTPPPVPDQRPERKTPIRTARADVRDGTPADRKKTGADDKDRRADAAAECRELMKNPPARSGANFRRPAQGLIVSRFGKKLNGQRNDGINISVPRGTPVKAAENGVVVYAGDELTGLGNLILVRHADGWVSAYAHNARILVSRCDTVTRGQEIARAGVTGSVSKPQVHFELRKNARPVDPEKHIAGTS